MNAVEAMTMRKCKGQHMAQHLHQMQPNHVFVQVGDRM